MAKEYSKKQLMELVEGLVDQNRELKEQLTKQGSKQENGKLFTPKVSKLDWTLKQREAFLNSDEMLHMTGEKGKLDPTDISDACYNIKMAVEGDELVIRHKISEAYDRSGRGNPVSYKRPGKACILFKGKFNKQAIGVYYVPGMVTLVSDIK